MYTFENYMRCIRINLKIALIFANIAMQIFKSFAKFANITLFYIYSIIGIFAYIFANLMHFQII